VAGSDEIEAITYTTLQQKLQSMTSLAQSDIYKPVSIIYVHGEPYPFL